MAHPNTDFAVGDIVRMTPAAFRHLRTFGPRADHWQLVPGFTGVVREVLPAGFDAPTRRGRHEGVHIMVEDVVGRIYNCRDRDLVQADC
jgi:hypothetical protein